MATAVLDIANVQQVIPPPPVKIPARQVSPSSVTQKKAVKQVSKDDETEGHNLHAEKTIEAAAEDIKAVVEALNRKIAISIEKDVNPDIIVTKLIDRDTDKVVRQIPSEEIIELSKRLDEFVGIVFNKKT